MQETTLPAAPTPALERPRTALLGLAVITLVGCVALALLGFVRPVVMGIVQGLGEFLPISSSAHLILVPWFFGWQGGVVDSLTFDVALHIGTLVALVVYFWRDWVALLAAAPALARWALQRARGDRHSTLAETPFMLGSVLVATVPGVIAGGLLQKYIEHDLRAPLLIAATLAIMGVALYVVDQQRDQQRDLSDLTWRDALLIGLAQACAVIPGFSRSGTTMTMGRFLRFDRAAAARYSFLMSAPITALAALAQINDLFGISAADLPDFIVGILVSGAVGALAIHFLLSYIRRAGFGVFAVYRLVVMLAIIIVSLLRG